jgi:hypothetical protein
MIYLILSIISMIGLFLAGRKVWWAWFLPAGVQLFWIVLTAQTNPPEFVFASLMLLLVYSFNAFTWVKDKTWNPLNHPVSRPEEVE